MAGHGRIHYGTRPSVMLHPFRVMHLAERVKNYVWNENNYVWTTGVSRPINNRRGKQRLSKSCTNLTLALGLSIDAASRKRADWLRRFL